MSTETQELELVAPDESAQVDNMKRADVGSIFKALETEIDPILNQASALVVTDAGQVAVQRVADEYRKQIKKFRCSVENRREEMVEGLNKQTKEINTAARSIREKCEKAEQRLLEIAEFAEREALRLEDGRRETRHAEIAPFLTGPLSLDLGKMSDEDYAKMLADAKDLAALREERVRKDKEAAEAKAKAEAEERERVRLENERLKKEVEESAKARAEAEAAARAEREEAALQLAAEREKAAAEAKAELEASRKREAQLAAAAKREREIAEAAAKKQREEIEAKARAEKEAADKENARLAAIAEAERWKAATAVREARAAREAIKRKEAAAKALAEKEEANLLATAEAARLAPEKDKLMAFAKTVLNLSLPEMETEKGQAAAAEIESQVVKFAAFIEKKAGAL